MRIINPSLAGGDAEPQFLRPFDATFSSGWLNSTDGLGAEPPLVNEATRDDTDYIIGTPDSYVTYDLDAAAEWTVQRPGDVIIRWAYRKSASGGRQIDTQLELSFGSSNISPIVIRSFTDISGVWTLDEYTLTASEFKELYDYRDITVKIRVFGVGGGQPRDIWVSWIEVQVPAASTPVVATPPGSWWNMDDDGVWADSALATGAKDLAEDGTVTISAGGGPGGQDVADIGATESLFVSWGSSTLFAGLDVSIVGWIYCTSDTSLSGAALADMAGISSAPRPTSAMRSLL
jgi:hypothetical protein